MLQRAKCERSRWGIVRSRENASKCHGKLQTPQQRSSGSILSRMKGLLPLLWSLVSRFILYTRTWYIYIYIYNVTNIVRQFQKYFVKILWIHKSGLFLEIIPICISGSFLKAMVQNGSFFCLFVCFFVFCFIFFGGGLLKFQIFLGVCLMLLIFLRGKQKMLVPSQRSKKKWEYPRLIGQVNGGMGV